MAKENTAELLISKLNQMVNKKNERIIAMHFTNEEFDSIDNIAKELKTTRPQVIKNILKLHGIFSLKHN